MMENEEYTPNDELAFEVQQRRPNTPLSDYLIAVIAHEANRLYCAMIGDYSQTVWAEASQWQRASILKGVAFIRANPDAGPEALHESWLAEKERDGWAYGPKKNAEAKLHPCFVPYGELPLDQRRKDALFQGVVRGLLKS